MVSDGVRGAVYRRLGRLVSGLEKGVVLVPRETPAGPAAARLAWADALGQQLVVTSRETRSKIVDVNCPADGRTVRRTVSALLEEYEPAGAVPEFGRSYASGMVRAAQEAARVPMERRVPDQDYWWKVVLVVRRVLEEERS